MITTYPFSVAQAGLSFNVFSFCLGASLLIAPLRLGAGALVIGVMRRLRPDAIPAWLCAAFGGGACVVGLLCLAYDLFTFDKPVPPWMLSFVAPAFVGGPLALWWSGWRRWFYTFTTLCLLLIGGVLAWFSIAAQRDDHLLRAADEGNTDFVMRGIAQGADVETADRERQTLLAHAVRSGRLETVRALLHAGADPNAVATTMITDAVLHRDAVMVKELLDGGADVRTVFYRGDRLVDVARGLSTPEIGTMIEEAMKNGPRPRRAPRNVRR